MQHQQLFPAFVIDEGNDPPLDLFAGVKASAYFFHRPLHSDEGLQFGGFMGAHSIESRLHREPALVLDEKLGDTALPALVGTQS